MMASLFLLTETVGQDPLSSLSIPISIFSPTLSATKTPQELVYLLDRAECPITNPTCLIAILGGEDDLLSAYLFPTVANHFAQSLNEDFNIFSPSVLKKYCVSPSGKTGGQLNRAAPVSTESANAFNLAEGGVSALYAREDSSL